MEDRCICCGEIIPEGRQVCPMCEGGRNETNEREEGDPRGSKSNRRSWIRDRYQ